MLVQQEKSTTEIDLTESNRPLDDSDYGVILDQFGFDYRTDEQYIYVGEPTALQGWVLHLSVIPTQTKALLEVLLPELNDSGLPFKLVRTKKWHYYVNEGYSGIYQIGKIVTIYLHDDTILSDFTNRLLIITKKFMGPPVITDFPLGGIIYTRYCSFIPKFERDQFGNHIKVIKDGHGVPFLDRYNIPPVIPDGIDNPFTSIIKNIPRPPKVSLIGKKYLPFKILKSDTKGDVWKALRFNRFYLPEFCVVKQGRKGMLPDEYGNDIGVRLKWQFDVNQKFKNILPQPEIFDFFTEDGHWYVAMKYLASGENFWPFIIRSLQCEFWLDHRKSLHYRILDYLLQIVRAIDIMHSHSYIHRDINGTNFMVTSKKIYLIDMELSFSSKENLPNPFFGIGTPGYMSPQQSNWERPDPKDDIYAIGALLTMVFFSGIDPSFVIDTNIPSLFSKLTAFTNSSDLSTIITKCLHQESSQRPTLDDIATAIQRYKETISANHAKVIPKRSQFTLDAKNDTKALMTTIEKAINTILGPNLANEGLWYSRVDEALGKNNYPLPNRNVYATLGRGVGGVIYLFNQIKKTEIPVSINSFNVETAFSFIRSEVMDRMNDISPSYLYGKAGLGATLAQSIQNGLLPYEEDQVELIESCFSTSTSGFDLNTGVAGIGIAAILSNSCLSTDRTQKITSHCVEILTRNQEKDGSWQLLPTHTASASKFGLFDGIGGIVIFLLEHARLSGDNLAINSAQRAMKFLDSPISKRQLHISTSNNACYRNELGYAHAFLKAYEVTNDLCYRHIAEKVLFRLPKRTMHYNVGHYGGICGLGELYLEAYRVTRNQVWLERAHWLAGVADLFKKEKDPGKVYWMVSHNDFQTADFLTGNSGVIHFLLRTCYPDKIGFPFLPFSGDK